MRLAVTVAALVIATSFSVVAFSACAEDAEPDEIEASATWSVTARGLSFDTRTIVVPAGGEVVIDFRNEHPGYAHNISIYHEDGGEALFSGEIIEGVDEIEYRFDAPQAGSYEFRCDPHPDRMRGTFVVRGTNAAAN